MNVNSLSEDPSLNIATMFVDGIYVIGGYHSIPLEESLELSCKRTSVYFMVVQHSVALSTTLKDHKRFPEKLERSIDLTLGEDGEMIFYSSFEGPITDMSGRIAVKSCKRDGIFTASDGGEMGEEQTESIAGSLVAKGDNWKLKLKHF